MKVDLPLTPPPSPPPLLCLPSPSYCSHTLIFTFFLPFLFLCFASYLDCKVFSKLLCRLLSRFVTLFFLESEEILSVFLVFSFLSVQNGLASWILSRDSLFLHFNQTDEQSIIFSASHTYTHTNTHCRYFCVLLSSLSSSACIYYFLIFKTYFFSHTFRKKGGYYIT